MTRPQRGGRVVVTTHLGADVGREVERLAQAHGVSRSAAVAALVGEAVRTGVEHSHGALLEATVRQAIQQEVRRVADLAFRAALDSDETRRLVIALLVRELGAEPARAMRREAHSASWERLKEPVAEQPERSGAWPAAPTRS